MSTVIKVEHICKKYIIRHEGTEQYKTLSGMLSNAVGKITSSSASPTKEDFWALDDISFEVNQGDRLAIIGRNGAGKSTLLKVLSRIVTPTKGRIEITGRVASLLEVGTGFHPELSGRENIFLNGSVLGMSKKEITKKFDEIVAFAEVEKFLDTPVKRYSSGMYVRLAFAVAAHLEPEILIVDEVLAVGDAEFQKKCLGKMNEVAGQGRTVLFVSHNMAAVSALCPNTIVLKNGKLNAIGATDKIINSYLHSDEKNSGETRDDSDAPSSAKLKIRSVRILNSKHELTPELNNSQEGFAEITFEILKEGRGYDVAIHLSHLQYGPIFTTCLKDLDTEKNDGTVLNKGLYKYLVKLPMDLLRGGDYTISASSAIPKVEFLDTFKYETTFFIFDSISPVAKTTEGRGGAVLPILKWEKV